MSYDGMVEADGINARIGTLVSGQVWEGAVPDNVTLATFSDGRIKPYIITTYATPIASTADRGLALGEKQQPYVLSGIISAFAADARTARLVISAATNLLVDWAPSATASAIKIPGGYSFTKPAKDSVPTRHECGCYFETTINLSIA